ncbi:MAG: NDP-sugar synthase [Pseudomonadota bacterium]
MILAAGAGTRLLPLTHCRPKPLFPILNHPLLRITFDYLSRFSVRRMILNMHHLAAQIEDFVHTQKRSRSFDIQTCLEPKILGTGGGIGQTRGFWKERTFLVINGDIVTDIDLQPAVDFHHNHQGPVTLILHDYPEFNQLSVDPDGRIRDFRLEKGKGLAFTGIHILDRRIFDFLPSGGSYEIIPVYQQMIAEGLPVRAYTSQGHYWRDIGTPKSYLKIHEELLATPSSFTPFIKGGLGEMVIHPEAVIEKGVKFSGWACIGKGCLLKSESRIHNSVLWEDAVVEPGVSVSESIVGSRVHVSRNIQEEILINK